MARRKNHNNGLFLLMTVVFFLMAINTLIHKRALSYTLSFSLSQDLT